MSPRLGRKSRSRSAVTSLGDHPEPTGLSIATHISPLRPTKVYDTFWRFAAERQAIYIRRLEGSPAPWTDDPILMKYKFTNPYRASDRVSQYLIRHVIYKDDVVHEANNLFFRILVFKLFNKVETWQALESSVGPIRWDTYSFDRYDAVLTKLSAQGNSIYSAAYIIPSTSREDDRKHRGHLRLVERMITVGVPERLTKCQTMQAAFELLKTFPGIGDFLAYQFATDINYSELTNFSEMDFVVPGPGALDGIRKCFRDLGSLNEPEIIKFMADRQEREFERLGLVFRSLWGRPLQLIDCQNLFCEVDKYARVHHPEVRGISGRSRIKQKFLPRASVAEPWFPPKWGINKRIAEWRDVVPKGQLQESVLTLFSEQ